MNSGIYLITTPSGKRYIGSAVDWRARMHKHLYRLRKGNHVNPFLQNTWNKHGEGCLVFQHVLCCEPMYLLQYEQLLMDELKPECNINKFASSRLGMVHSIEAKKKMAQAAIGRNVSSETRRKLASLSKGRKHSADTIAKMKNGSRKLTEEALGKLLQRTPEQRAAMRIRARDRGYANRGLKRSDAIKQKMGEAQARRLMRERLELIEWVYPPVSNGYAYAPGRQPMVISEDALMESMRAA